MTALALIGVLLAGSWGVAADTEAVGASPPGPTLPLALPPASMTTEGVAVAAAGVTGDAVWFSGSGATIDGPVISSADLRVSGSGSTFTASVTYAGTLRVSGSGARFALAPVPGGAVAIANSVADFSPGGADATAWQYRALYHDHSADCFSGRWTVSGSNVTLPSGVHWVPCEVRLTGSGLKGKATIVAAGKVTVSGSNTNLAPAVGETRSIISGFAGPGAVRLSGSNTQIIGTVIAPVGGVELTGSNGSASCGVWASTVRVSGSGATISASKCPSADLPEECLGGSTTLLWGVGEVIVGSDRDDTIVGTTGDDVICGRDGNDTIDGGGGDDLIYGGRGDDRIRAGTGDDYASGDAGVDLVEGGDGADRLFGGDDGDTVDGGLGDDKVWGVAGDDVLNGGEGNDLVDGGDGTGDTADGGLGEDTCIWAETTLGCEIGDEVRDPLATPLPVPAQDPVGPLTFTTSGDVPGVSLSIETNGVITPFNLSITPARQYMTEAMNNVLAGVAVDISVPNDSPPFSSASLTMPYNAALLDGFDPALLRVYNYDEAAQVWLPVPGPQVVDTAGRTVTAQLEHFSVYAVMRIEQSSDWASVFADLPLRCVGGGTGDPAVELDVVFLVDTSGSMSSNDPTRRRVAGARAFLDEMRDQDRAAVVGFGSAATTYANLSEVGPNRTQLATAIDNTGLASGGTNLSAPVSRAISILGAPTADRLRVAILLTDGVGTYSSGLTTQAAQAGIEIYTIGLGSDVNGSLLQSIADGTGGRYQQLAAAEDLPALYRQLAGDLISNDTDTDEDQIPDCVERNGAFAPRIVIDYGVRISFSSWFVTDPADNDTDGDGLIDGFEIEAAKFSDDPRLAAEYDFLVDAGLDTYYLFRSDPNVVDTDGDDIDDLLEFQNGTDPATYDGDIETDIESLDLPPFTLLQHFLEEPQPVVQQRFRPVVDDNGTLTSIDRVVYNDQPVTYASDLDCVDNCAEIEALATRRNNGNGFGICLWGAGDCVTEAEQRQGIMIDAVLAQGIFELDLMNGLFGNDFGGRRLSVDFVREQAALQCILWSGLVEECIENAEQIDLTGDATDVARVVYEATVIAIPVDASGGPVTLNPEWIRRLVAGAVATTAAIAIPKVIELTESDVETAIKACLTSPVLEAVASVGIQGLHPCEVLPIYAPGTDIGEAHTHRVTAIAADPTRLIEHYQSETETAAKGIRRNWMIGQPGCTDLDKQNAIARTGGAVTCDEFPNYSMRRAGPGASIKYVDSVNNIAEGVRYGVFVNNPQCGGEIKAPLPEKRAPFIVVPTPLPITLFSCGL